MTPDINQYLAETAKEIADGKIADREKYFLEDNISFSFYTGDYYFKYRLKSDSSYWQEQEHEVITVSLKEVLKTIMENEERRMKVGDIVYHPQFRREGQYTGSGIVREVEDKDRWDNVNVLVQWSGGVEEWYIQEELAFEKENEE